jgi:hypothetical protein
MSRRRLAAAAAAASLAAVAFVSTASPASAWTKEDCKPYAEKGEYPYDCVRFKPKPTTTTQAEKTTTTAKATTTTTVAVKEEAKKPTPVKAQPKFTGLVGVARPRRRVGPCGHRERPPDTGGRPTVAVDMDIARPPDS